jgi:hypothetical protein
MPQLFPNRMRYFTYNGVQYLVKGIVYYSKWSRHLFKGIGGNAFILAVNQETKERKRFFFSDGKTHLENCHSYNRHDFILIVSAPAKPKVTSSAEFLGLETNRANGELILRARFSDYLSYFVVCKEPYTREKIAESLSVLAREIINNG